MKKTLERLDQVLRDISSIQQRCVKEKGKDKYIDVEERELHLNSEDLKKWFSLNMQAQSLMNDIRFKLTNPFNL